jgi:glutathione S-transferase
VWLLEELNLEYELKVFKRNAAYRAGADLKAVHPLGRSPVIGITPAGSDKEIIIAESETIVEYVCEHFGRDLGMIPQRYPEGKEGVLGAETEDYMRYKVCHFSWLAALWMWIRLHVYQASALHAHDAQVPAISRCTPCLLSLVYKYLPPRHDPDWRSISANYMLTRGSF